MLIYLTALNCTVFLKKPKRNESKSCNKWFVYSNKPFLLVIHVQSSFDESIAKSTTLITIDYDGIIEEKMLKSIYNVTIWLIGKRLDWILKVNQCYIGTHLKIPRRKYLNKYEYCL